MKLAVLVAVLPLLATGLLLGLRLPFRGPLALYAAVVPFGSGLTIPVHVPSPFNTVSTLLGLVAIAAVAAHLAGNGRRAERLVTAVPIFVLFSALAAASWMWSVNPSATGRNITVLLSLVALFTVVALSRVEHRDVQVIELAIMAGGCLVSAYGLYLLATGSLASTSAGVARFATAGGAGESTDPNITAAALLLPLMLIMTRLVRARGPLPLMSALGALTLVLTGILLTGSRGGLVAAGAGMVTVLVYERGRHVIKYAAPLAIVAAVAFAVAPPALQNRFTDPSSTGRSDIWQVGLRGCQQHCLSGSGLGTFPDVYRTTLLTSLDLKGHGVQDFKAHNIWLAMVVETGFAGLLLGVAGVGLLLRDVQRLPRSARTGPLAGMVAVLVANMFLSNFNFKYFWLVLTYAVLVVLAEPASEAEVTAGELHPVAV